MSLPGEQVRRRLPKRFPVQCQIQEPRVFAHPADVHKDCLNQLIQGRREVFPLREENIIEPSQPLRDLRVWNLPADSGQNALVEPFRLVHFPGHYGRCDQSGETASTMTSAAAMRPARRLCQGSPGAISCLSR